MFPKNVNFLLKLSNFAVTLMAISKIMMSHKQSYHTINIKQLMMSVFLLKTKKTS